MLKTEKEIYPTSTLITIDFNNCSKNQSIEYIIKFKKLAILTNSGIDLVTTSHVLEHILDPISFLTEIGKRLNKEGRLFVDI